MSSTSWGPKDGRMRRLVDALRRGGKTGKESLQARLRTSRRFWTDRLLFPVYRGRIAPYPDFRYSRVKGVSFLGNLITKGHRSSPHDCLNCLLDISGGGCGGRTSWSWASSSC